MGSIRYLIIVAPVCAALVACGGSGEGRTATGELTFQEELELAVTSPGRQHLISPLELGADSLEAETEGATSESPPAPAVEAAPRPAARSTSQSTSIASAPAPAPVARTVTVKNTKRDAAIGAGAGAVIGAVAGGSENRVEGAVVGAVLGGVIGGVIGNNVDKSTRVVYE
jgi:hypothetical protein